MTFGRSGESLECEWKDNMSITPIKMVMCMSVNENMVRGNGYAR